jgi:hypothetical protein
MVGAWEGLPKKRVVGEAGFSSLLHPFLSLKIDRLLPS